MFMFVIDGFAVAEVVNVIWLHFCLLMIESAINCSEVVFGSCLL